MKKLFSKLTAMYLGVLFIGYIIITVGVSYLLTAYLMNTNATELIHHSQSFEEAYVEMAEINASPFVSKVWVKQELRNMSKYVSADIWMMDREGQVYVTSNDAFELYYNSEMSVDDLDTIFEGNIINKQVQFEKIYQQPSLTIGYPISADGEVRYALFTSIPVPEIQKATFGITRIVFFSLFLVALIAMFMLFGFTRNMNREFEELNEAVRVIASGNLEQQIKISRNYQLGELAKNINYMSSELRKSVKSQERFISNLSHDLRSPMTTIIGYIRAILDGTVPPEKHERYLNIALDESERLKKFVNNILDLSKMQSGDMPLAKSDFDINQMVIHELDRFEKRIIDKKVKLFIELSDEKVLAHADPNAIQRVVYNLIDNALKFVDMGGAIRIKTEIKGEKWLVGIQNSGALIPQEKLASIWDRFNKLDDSRGQRKESSGLGLAIIREIIRVHEEKIEVYSNEQVGVMFVFSLGTQIFKDVRGDQTKV